MVPNYWLEWVHVKLWVMAHKKPGRVPSSGVLISHTLAVEPVDGYTT